MFLILIPAAQHIPDIGVAMIILLFLYSVFAGSVLFFHRKKKQHKEKRIIYNKLKIKKLMFLPFFSKSLKKEIIPVINVKTKQKFEERLHQLSKFSGIFQIDVADGNFTSRKNWNAPEEIKTIKGIRQKFELHLMVKNPEIVLPLWLETRPKRIIIHQEALKDFDAVYKMCQIAKVELALALNPSTPIDSIKGCLKKINFVVFLSVAPGPSGQKFQWHILDKIQDLRKKYPQLNIEVDGGINDEILPEVLKAGANYLAIGSAIFERENPKEKILAFQKMLCEKKYEKLNGK